jgi:ATP-dependent Lon protease
LLTHSPPRRWRFDPSLQVACDLGDVSLRGTANRLDPLPAARRDRMRAVSVPQPAAEHRDALRAIVMNDVACERVMAAAWVERLDGTERDLITDNRRGGSLRQLRRFVEAAMIARERGRTTPWMFGPGDSGRHFEPGG